MMKDEIPWFEISGTLPKVRRLLAERPSVGYLVGGYVRDLLLHRSTRDLDLAVIEDALPLAREAADLLGGAFVVLDEERHTGRVVLRDGTQRYYLDFATLRGGGLYTDLAARDFTINAMAIDAQESAARPEIIDPFEGRRDLERGLLRAVSDSIFEDDAIRLLRGVRLSAELGLVIEEHTEQLVIRDASLIAQASAERCRDELVRILAAERAEGSLRHMDRLGLLSPIILELNPLRGLDQPPPHYQDAFQHSLTVVGALDELCRTIRLRAHGVAWLTLLWGGEGEGLETPLTKALSPYSQRLVRHLDEELVGERRRLALLKLAGLLHDVGKSNTGKVDEKGRTRFFGHAEEGAAVAGEVARRLRLGNREVGLVRAMVQHHMRLVHLARLTSMSRRAIYRFFRDTGAAGIDVLLLSLGDNLALVHQGRNVEQWQRVCQAAGLLLEAYYERYGEVVEPEPLLSGGDLLERLGMEPGPEVGRILRALREAQATGQITSEEEALRLAEDLVGKRSG
jgi:putative nucleotidyltransferase with HDIG domain